MSRPWKHDRDTRTIEARLPPRYRLDSGYDDDPSFEGANNAPKRPRVRYMPPLDAPLLSQVATMSGFLRKQADNEPGKWTKYFFVLKPTTYLYYYNTEHDADPRGIIDVEFLRDVRFNADCVQRSVGGSAYGFRVTGQLPPAFCDGGNGSHASQLRPVYLDAESREQANAWMEAIRHHRFDLSRHNDYEDLLSTMDAADKHLTKLTDQNSQLWTTSQKILLKASGYLGKLRGMDMPADTASLTGSTSPKVPQSTEEALRSISISLDEIFAEGERQRRLVEILRERENEHFQREAQLKGCEADLKIQALRCQQLERELERMMKERQEHDEIYEAKHASIVAREREVATREEELQTLSKQRDREFEHKMEQVEKRSIELTNQLKRETAVCLADLAKQRKTLEKQQKLLEKKQKLMELRLPQKPSLKSGLVAAVRKSLPSASPKEAALNRVGLEGAEGDVGMTESERPDTSVVASSRSLPDKAPSMCNVLAECAEPIGPQRNDDEVVQRTEEAGEVNGVLEARFTSGGLSSQSSSGSSRSIELVDHQSPANPSSSSVTAQSSVSDAASVMFTQETPTPRLLDSNMTDRLPPEWTCRESKSFQGRLYYFNIFTGETRWDFPLDVLGIDDGYDKRLDGDQSSRVSSAVESGGRVITTESETQEENLVAGAVQGDVPSKPKAPWRNKFMAKVAQRRAEGKTAVLTPPRSPADEPVLDKVERCEF